MPGCTECHAGYGWKDASFNFTNTNNIDCLVCHAASGTYQKANAGQVAPEVDLVKAAQSVGKPTRANCGTCRFYAGGGDGVKHGGLDSSLVNPPRQQDVHMGGTDMACQDCHQTTNHKIAGGSVHILPTDNGRIACADCHSAAPHQNNPVLDQHTSTVARQTCHIPAYATGMPTKVYWDWSTAGEDREVAKDAYGRPTYDKAKGTFVWEKDVRPTYAWYNGLSDRYIIGEPINKEGVTTLARPAGSISDPQARIYPFKVIRGKQPADPVNGYLLTPKLGGGFWEHFDWQKALIEGAKATGLKFSCQYDFVETEMYMVINHGVVPEENALTCTDCHGASGVLDFQALGYPGDPMQAGGRGQNK